MRKFEVYSFSKVKYFGKTEDSLIGWMTESFDNEKDAQDYAAVMNKQNKKRYRIKRIEEEWLS